MCISANCKGQVPCMHVSLLRYFLAQHIAYLNVQNDPRPSIPDTSLALLENKHIRHLTPH